MSLFRGGTVDLTCTVIDDLNDDCLLRVLKFIGLSDRFKAELVCRRWRNLCSLLWQRTSLFDAFDKQFQNGGRNNHGYNVPMIKKILSKCQVYLTQFNLSKSPKFDDAYFTEAGHNCPVSFHECGFPPGPLGVLNDLKKFLLNCENIEELELCACILSVDDKFLEHLFKKNRNLRSIVLSKYQLKGKCFAHLSPQTVESIVLNECEMNLKLYDSVVSHAPNLKTVKFKRTNDLVSSYLRIETLTPTNLLHLSVEDVYFPFKHISDLYKLKGLLSLKLKLRTLKDSTLKRVVENCTQLRQLDLMKNQELTDLSFRHANTLPHLKCLAIGLNRNFTDAGLRSLKGNLRELDVSGTSCSADGLLTMIRRMHCLEQLNVSFLEHLNNDFVQTVMDVVESRPNRIPLTIKIYRTSIDMVTVRNTCPLLELVNDYRLRMNYQKYV